MKKILLVTAAWMLAYAAFPQGQVNFDNLANPDDTTGDNPGAVNSPIFNLDSACPTCYKSGNIATANPRTTGSTTYGGTRLFNTSSTHFTATLWARNSTAVSGDAGANNLALVGTTTMRTSTTGQNSGRVALSTANPIVADVVPGSSDRGTFQLRVWDDRGGTIATWDQAINTVGLSVGYSPLFTVPFALGSANNPTPNLAGLQSFQLFQVVPEPSVIALGVLGAGCLFLLRRRK